MIKVLSSPNLAQKIVCHHCGSLLEYMPSDCVSRQEKDFVCRVTLKTNFITCPVCKNELILSKRYYDWD